MRKDSLQNTKIVATVGPACNTYDKLLELVKAGVDALLVVTPYYIRPPQRGLVAYYLALAAQHEVPWMICR